MKVIGWIRSKKVKKRHRIPQIIGLITLAYQILHFCKEFSYPLENINSTQMSLTPLFFKTATRKKKKVGVEAEEIENLIQAGVIRSKKENHQRETIDRNIRKISLLEGEIVRDDRKM